jgi:hypothetical protein
MNAPNDGADCSVIPKVRDEVRVQGMRQERQMHGVNQPGVPQVRLGRFAVRRGTHMITATKPFSVPESSERVLT